MNESPDCAVCSRQLWEDETGRQACKLCQRVIDDHLRSLAGPRGLYARVCLRNETGSSSTGPRVSGSAEAGIAGKLDVLDLTAEGGLVSVLEGWVADWASQGFGIIGSGGRLQHRVDQAVETLRRNLPQAVLRHPAISAFANEIYLYLRRCEWHIDGEPVASFKVTCTCSRELRIPLTAVTITCHHCDAGYGYEEIRHMAAAQRAAA